MRILSAVIALVLVSGAQAQTITSSSSSSSTTTTTQQPQIQQVIQPDLIPASVFSVRTISPFAATGCSGGGCGAGAAFGVSRVRSFAFVQPAASNSILIERGGLFGRRETIAVNGQNGSLLVKKGRR